MKNLAILVVVALFTISINAQIGPAKKVTATKKSNVTQEKDPNAPVIIFATQTVDYGVIEKGSDGTREFKFTNTGKSIYPLLSTK